MWLSGCPAHNDVTGTSLFHSYIETFLQIEKFCLLTFSHIPMTPWDRSNLLRRLFFVHWTVLHWSGLGRIWIAHFVSFSLFFSSSSLHWPSNYSAIPFFFKILYSGLYIFLGFSILKYLFFYSFLSFLFCCVCTSFNFSWPKSRLVLFSSCKYNIIKYLKWQVWHLWTQWRERSRLCSSRRMTQKIELWFYSASWTMSASSGRKWDKYSYFFVLTCRLYTIRILLRVTSVNCSKKSSRAPLKTIIVCLGEQWDLDADVRLWNEGVGPKGQSDPKICLWAVVRPHCFLIQGYYTSTPLF